MPEVVFTTRGADRVTRSQEQIVQNFETGAKKTITVTRKVTQEQLKGIKDAEQAGRRLAIQEADQAKKKEQDWRQWTKTVDQARQAQMSAYEAMNVKVGELSKAVKKLGEDESLVTEERIRLLKQYRDEVGNAEGKLDDVNRELNELGESGEESFGAPAVANIKGFITSLGATLGPLALIKSAYDQITAARMKAMEAATESRFSFGAFRQLADTQEELDDLVQKAEDLYKSGATRSLEQAGRVIFSIASAGLLDDESYKMFRELGKTGTIEDLATLARATKTQLASMGRQETGGAAQIVSKAFAASKYSPSSVEELLEAASRAGGVGQMLGMTDEELMAAVALLATSTGSADIGATALESFLFATAEKPEFAGLGVKERVQKLAGMGMSVAQLKEYLGRKEAVRGFAELQKSLSEFDTVQAAIERANTDRTIMRQKLGLTDLPRDVAGFKAREEARGETQMTVEGMWENAAAALERRRERERRERFGTLFGTIGSAFEDVGDVLNWPLGPRAAAERKARTDEEREYLKGLLDYQIKQYEEQQETNRKLDDSGLVGVAE